MSLLKIVTDSYTINRLIIYKQNGSIIDTYFNGNRYDVCLDDGLYKIVLINKFGCFEKVVLLERCLVLYFNRENPFITLHLLDENYPGLGIERGVISLWQGNMI